MSDSESDSATQKSVSNTQITPTVSTVSTPSQNNQIPDSQNVKNKQVLKLRDASMKVLGIVKTCKHNLKSTLVLQSSAPTPAKGWFKRN